MTELKKITSKNGHVYLFKDIQHKQRNELGIASGQSVLISILNRIHSILQKIFNLFIIKISLKPNPFLQKKMNF